MKILTASPCLAALLLLSPLLQADNNPYAGVYYGELDEQITDVGIIVQHREKTADITVTVSDNGDLSVTGIAGVSGVVEDNGVINFFANGFGFTTGSISDGTVNAYGKHEQDGGLKVDEYWIVAQMNVSVAASFPDALAAAGNWNWTEWFGWFWGGDFPWIYHTTLGHVYCSGSDQTFLWLYYLPLGWIGTNATTYPWFYDSLLDAWLFYQVPSVNPNWFYNSSSDKWIQLTND